MNINKVAKNQITLTATRVWLQYLILFLVSSVSCTFDTSYYRSLNATVALPALSQIPLSPTTAETIYNGNGSVTFIGGELDFQPAAPVGSSDTHASLILLKETESNPVRDFELIVDVTTVQQLRGVPNDWEVFWLVFGYQGSVTQKTSNYFTEKPNTGIELGIMQGVVGQNFLHTSPSSVLTVGTRDQYRYLRQGSLFTVDKNGTNILTYISALAFPNQLYDGKGSIGFYSEDARVIIHSVQYRNLDSVSPALPSQPIVPAIAFSDSYKTPYSGVVTSSGPLFTEVTKIVTSFSSNTTSTGGLFWSCNVTNVNSVSIFAPQLGSSCSEIPSFMPAIDGAKLKGTISFTNGILTWSPLSNQVGTYLFNFEASQLGGGYAENTIIVQVVPGIHEDSRVFTLDPQFSKSYTVSGSQVYLERINGSADDTLSDWPSLIGTAKAMLNFSEIDPWRGDGSVSDPFALHFDGSQTSLALDENVFLGKPGVKVTLWVKPAAPTASTTLFSQLDGGGEGFFVRQASDSSGKIDASYINSGTTNCRSQSALNAGDWNEVTAQVSTGFLRLYINGEKECEASLTTALNANAAPILIGASPGGTGPWAGDLGEVHFSARTDSSQPVSDLHVAEDFLVAGNRYRLTPIGGIIAKDLILHYDAANATRGLEAPGSSSSTSWWNLSPHRFSPTFYNFDGNSSSGWQSLGTPSQAYLKFDGTDDSIVLNADPRLSLSSEWTIEAWIQPGPALGGAVFKTIAETFDYNPNKGGFGLRLGGNNTVDAFVVDNTVTATVQGANPLSANSWYQVAATFSSDDQALRVYMNGELSATQSVLLNPTNGGDNPFFLGLPADYNSANLFNGGLAIVRVYNKRLTRFELRQNCWAQKDRFPGSVCAN